MISYRGMLQVLLQRHGLLPADYCTNINANQECDIKVGRMTKKCETFRDYVVFALKRFPKEVSVPPDTLVSSSKVLM